MFVYRHWWEPSHIGPRDGHGDRIGAKAAAEREAEKQRKEKERQQRYDAPTRFFRVQGCVHGNSMICPMGTWEWKLRKLLKTVSKHLENMKDIATCDQIAGISEDHGRVHWNGCIHPILWRYTMMKCYGTSNNMIWVCLTRRWIGFNLSTGLIMPWSRDGKPMESTQIPCIPPCSYSHCIPLVPIESHIRSQICGGSHSFFSSWTQSLYILYEIPSNSTAVLNCPPISPASPCEERQRLRHRKASRSRSRRRRKRSRSWRSRGRVQGKWSGALGLAIQLEGLVTVTVVGT